MGNPTALRALRTVCISCRLSLPSASTVPSRAFSSSSRALASYGKKADTNLDQKLANVEQNFMQASPFQSIIPGPDGAFKNLVAQEWEADQRHHLHIYAHKHNTHLTLTKPNRDPLISVSCGNIGFRKAGRGTYDAAYQLAAFVMSRIQDKGLLPSIKSLELVYRGFGSGREAVTKAIMGSEGKKIRPLVNKLSDGTRLKFGGVRSKKPRRLG